MSFHVPEHRRVRGGPLGSDVTDGNNGSFVLDSPLPGRMLVAIASDGLGWEHVSLRAMAGKRSRIPTWDEMAYAKRVFWDAEDVVVQYHPPESTYVNNHPHVLHLWRPVGIDVPLPPSALVGVPWLIVSPEEAR